MDHFRVSYIWVEKSVRGKAFYKVRFDKIVRGKSWWTAQPAGSFRGANAIRPSSGKPMRFLQYSNSSHLCRNMALHQPKLRTLLAYKRRLRSFRDLSLDQRFLKHWLPNIPWFKPGFELAPDFASNRLTLREIGQITVALRSLWRGIIRPQCRKCNPHIYWNLWTCNNCDIDYPPDPRLIELQSIITRSPVSYVGHPMISPEWPKK